MRKTFSPFLQSAAANATARPSSEATSDSTPLKGFAKVDRRARSSSRARVQRGSLIQHVAGIGNASRMPPKGDPLTADQIGALRAWIDQGAITLAVTGKAPAKRAENWALVPLKRPAIPTTPVAHQKWVRNPVDAFVLQKLLANGLGPSPEADRRTLIRRLSVDLTGLVPTPQEIEAFQKDQSPNAYEKLVDRLLATPRYGERWARHWMDVVHYADSHGHDEDGPRPNAWPYRDYLIRSFNDDKPYARFVEEQIAGDARFPDDPAAIIATGFLAAGPWDQSGLAGIREDSIDRLIAYYLDRDDMVTTTFSTFAGLTVGAPAATITSSTRSHRRITTLSKLCLQGSTRWNGASMQMSPSAASGY